MADPGAVADFLQRRLDSLGLQEVPAVEAARWLDDAGILRDSPDRPGLPLRKMLRAGGVPQAEQRPQVPSGRWFIVRSLGGFGATRPTDLPAPGTTSVPPTDDQPVRGASTVDVVANGGRHVTKGWRNATEASFTRLGLMKRGFTGFTRCEGIDLQQVPSEPGVYVVLREKDSAPSFLERNPAGWYKGQDPTVAVAELETSWPTGAQCVYIGKAGAGAGGRRGLPERIKEFRQYGDGRPVGHQGGRRIWQLSDADDFVLAWITTPAADPGVLEAVMLRAFVSVYGRLPIGNRTMGASRT